MPNQIATSAFSFFGSGAIKNLMDIIKNRDFQRILVITDGSAEESGAAKKITSLIAKNKLVYQVFDRVNMAATVNSVKAAVEAAKSFRADVLVALGSGSVMDTAKAAAVLLGNPDIIDARKLEGRDKSNKPAIPLYLVYSSVGNARGFGYDVMLDDEAQRKKIECFDVHALADAVVCDSDIFASSKDFAVSSMALIASSVEALVCKEAWLMTDINAVESIKIIAENVKDAVKGTAAANAAKEQILYGQYLAGLAVSNSSAGLATAMANALEAANGVPAKLTSALLLSGVMQHNAAASGTKYKNIALALGAKISAAAKPDAYRKAAVAAVEKLAKDLKLPKVIEGLELTKDDLEFLADNVMKSTFVESNPKAVTKKKIIDLYKTLVK